MQLQKAMCRLIAASAVFAGTNQLSAGDRPSFLERVFPVPKFMREQETEDHTKATTHAEAVLFEIQKRREQEPVDDDIEVRIRDVMENRSPIMIGPPVFSDGGRPTLEELREHLISRGVDPQNIDRHIDRVAESASRGKGRSNERRMINRGTNSNGDPISTPGGTGSDGDTTGELPVDDLPMNDDMGSPEGDGLGDPTDIASAVTAFAAEVTVDSSPTIDISDDMIEIIDRIPIDDAVELPIDKTIDLPSDPVLFDDLLQPSPDFDHPILLGPPISSEQSADVPVGTTMEPNSGHAVDHTVVVEEAILKAGETASTNAHPEAPVSTVVTPTFQRSGAGLRGGFGRGRIRD